MRRNMPPKLPVEPVRTHQTWCCRRSLRASPPGWGQRGTAWCSLHRSRCSARAWRWTGWREARPGCWSRRSGTRKRRSGRPGSSADLRREGRVSAPCIRVNEDEFHGGEAARCDDVMCRPILEMLHREWIMGWKLTPWQQQIKPTFRFSARSPAFTMMTHRTRKRLRHKTGL